MVATQSMFHTHNLPILGTGLEAPKDSTPLSAVLSIPVAARALVFLSLGGLPFSTSLSVRAIVS